MSQSDSQSSTWPPSENAEREKDKAAELFLVHSGTVD